MSEEKYKNIIQKYYQKFLDREPDEEGLNHYLSLLKEKKILLEELENFFINSLEYKTQHPIKYEKNCSDEQKMKMDWDARVNLLNFPFTDASPARISEYWAEGQRAIEKVIGLNTPLFDQMFAEKDLKKLKVLDIGAGLGRVLIPASKIFQESIGVDVSHEMVTLSKKYIKTNNCRILENNGKDLSMFSNDYFDFCYSIATVQHFPKKSILLDYMKEISRVLKNGVLFRLIHIIFNQLVIV